MPTGGEGYTTIGNPEGVTYLLLRRVLFRFCVAPAELAISVCAPPPAGAGGYSPQALSEPSVRIIPIRRYYKND